MLRLRRQAFHGVMQWQFLVAPTPTPHPTPTRTAINPSMREESKSLHDGECVNAGHGTIISYVKLFIKVCVGLLCRFSLDLNSLLEIL